MAKKAWKDLEGQYFRIDVGSTEAEALASEESNVIHITTEQSIVMNGEVVGRGGNYIRFICRGSDGTKPVITVDGTDMTLGSYGFYNVEANESISYKSGAAAISSIDVSHWNPTNLTSLKRAFYNFQQIRKLDLSNIDVSNVTSMNSCFLLMRLLNDLDMKTWDTSKVEDMNGMFANCINLKEINLTSFCLRSINTDGLFPFAATKAGNSTIVEKLYLGKFFFDAPNLTYANLKCTKWADTDSVSFSLYTNLFNRKEAGQPTLTLALSSATLNVLTDTQKTRLTDYGYTLA